MPNGYLDFDLLVTRGPDGYRAQVIQSPAGEAVTVFAPPDAAPFAAFWAGVGQARDTTRGFVRVATTASASARDVGGRLFDAAFGGDVGVCLLRGLDEARRQGKGLRLRLRLTDAPELATWPWEYLYVRSRDVFLGLSEETPIVRYLDLPDPAAPLATTGPLQVLVAVAAPHNLPPLDTARERANIEQALGALVTGGQIAVDRLDHATLPALQAQLQRAKYHILHYIGHGGFDATDQSGALALEGEGGQAQLVSGDRLGRLLRDQRTLRLAVLNACEGGRSAEANPFAGVAQALARQGLPAVVAMQFKLLDQTAITLARAFYDSVARGKAVDTALAVARQAVFAAADTDEWGTPVLYMRAPDGVLWTGQEETSMSQSDDKPWWADLPLSAGGDIIIGTAGAGARGVAIGKGITQQIGDALGPPTPSDNEVVQQGLAAVAAALAQARPALDGPTAMMAEFQLKLLGGELGKTEDGETPSANTITQVGDWLLANVAPLSSPLKTLFAQPAVGRVLVKAGASATTWARDRFGG